MEVLINPPKIDIETTRRKVLVVRTNQFKKPEELMNEIKVLANGLVVLPPSCDWEFGEIDIERGVVK